MNNLRLSWERSLNIELQSKEEALLVSAFDIERNRLFFASSANYIYTIQLPQSQKGAWRRTSPHMEGDLIDLEPGDSIMTLGYLMEKEELIVGTCYGQLLLYSGNDNPAELVGRVDGGVKCISPSPDGDLLGIITGLGQILVMTLDWDLLYETALEDVVEEINVRESNSSVTFESSISWRGDGKYFSTLSGHLSLHKKLKVWERDAGTLHAASESKAFMGATLDWMPSGPKIVAVYDRSVEKKAPLIVFFERNGLERSFFSVDVPVDAKIENLQWNCNSDLLAAVVRCNNYDSVKIWLFSNNHWYLKQETRYLKKDQVTFMWDPTKPLQLICWSIGGQISTFNYIWVTAVTDNSMALVVDGNKVLVTPLSLSLMPPPMYLFSLKFSSAVRDVVFFLENSRNRLVALSSDGCLSVVELPLPDACEQLEGKEFSVEACNSEVAFQSLAHLTWLDSYVLLGVSQCGSSHGTGSDGDTLLEIKLFCSEDHVAESIACCGWCAKISHQTSVEEVVIGVASSPSKKHSALIQFDGGKIFQYVSKLGMAKASLGSYLENCTEISFLSACPWMSVISVCYDGLCQPLLIGLDEIGRFYVGAKVLCNNCISFSFYSKFGNQVMTHLALATKQDLLFIVDVVDVLDGNIDAEYGNFMRIGNRRKEEENGKFINIWERGAKIVGVLHGDDAAVIIQTNRGNLECIYPRKLVLVSIVNALVQKRFGDALVMVRRHRIDFNIIIDHQGWWEFLQSAAEFVKQVNNLSYITEVICAIKNENIMEALYKNYLTLPCSKEVKGLHVQNSMDSHANGKVFSVLLAIRQALEEHMLESPARELCILTTLARSSPPALDKALERIKFIREMELSGFDDPRRNSYPSAEEALKHLLWLSDTEAVYDAALGLYDLNLAAMVALNSQKDPKEFLPFLQELECMPPVLMRYNVDLKLQRYESALRNIVLAGDAYHADCMELVKNNPQLFPLGLQLFKDPAKRMQVFEAWGDHLSDEKCFEDAAATFLCCSCLEKALTAYRACGHWRGVLTTAGLLKLEEQEVLQLAHELCEELQMLGRLGEAAQIALEYCGDVNNGISLLISARNWEEALRVSFLNRKDELIITVKDAALECASLLINEYRDGLEKVGKYLARYLAVRQRRLLLAAKLESDNQSTNDLDDDTASETSSNISGMSAYTTGTRKSSASISSKSSKAGGMRRQRNKGKIRAGSPGEELALVEHLQGMSLSSGAKVELKSLISALLILGEEEMGRKLQCGGESFQLSQMAAVKLMEDTMLNDSIDEHAHTLEHYTQKLRNELLTSDAFSWRSRVLLSS